MKNIILALIFTTIGLCQTYDSLTVNWTDSPSSDLDSTYLVYFKTNPVVDTAIFARVDEGIETWSGVAPDSGLLYIGAVGLDDSSNFCLDSASVFDTVTVWVQTGGGSPYITDSLQHYWWVDSLAGGSVDSWTDIVSACSLTVSDTSYRPVKSGSSIIFDGNDLIRSDQNASFNFSGQPMTIEVVVNIQDTTTNQMIYGVRNTSMLSIGMVSSRISVWFFDGSNYVVFNDYSSDYLGTHHIMVTWGGDGTVLGTVYLDGVERTSDIGDLESDIPGDNRVYIGGASGLSEVPSGTDIPLARAYNLELSSANATTNYNSDSVQDLLP